MLLGATVGIGQTQETALLAMPGLDRQPADDRSVIGDGATQALRPDRALVVATRAP